jgi:hypothetical protein
LSDPTPQVNPVPATPKKRLYWATMPFMNFIFPKGKVAVFRHHRYATDIAAEIEELDKEVANNHPHIYVKQEMMYLTEEMEDPMKALRSKIIAEYLAQQAAHTDPANDMGSSSQEPIRPQSTTDIASVAAGGDATQAAAKLVELTKSMAAASAATKK